MTSIYIYLRDQMLKEVDQNSALPRKRCLAIVGLHLKSVPKPQRKEVLKDMSAMRLIEKVNRDVIRILKPIENNIFPRPKGRGIYP